MPVNKVCPLCVLLERYNCTLTQGEPFISIIPLNVLPHNDNTTLETTANIFFMFMIH